MKRALLLLAILSTVVLASVAYRYLHEESLVDDCLSGEHGSFDYSTMSCDLENNHPYIPYHVRHPYDKTAALVGFISLALTTSAYGYVRLRTKRDSS
jgi:hypothetical protein